MQLKDLFDDDNISCNSRDLLDCICLRKRDKEQKKKLMSSLGPSISDDWLVHRLVALVSNKSAQNLSDHRPTSDRNG